MKKKKIQKKQIGSKNKEQKENKPRQANRKDNNNKYRHMNHWLEDENNDYTVLSLEEEE